VSKLLLGLVSSSVGAAVSCYLSVVYALDLKWKFLLSYLIQAVQGELPGTIVPSTNSIFEVLLVVALWEALSLIASIYYAGWNGSLASVAAFLGALVVFWPNNLPMEAVGVVLVAAAYLVAFEFEPEPPPAEGTEAPRAPPAGPQGSTAVSVFSMKNFHARPSLSSFSSLFLLFQTHAGMSIRAIGSVLITTATDLGGSPLTNFSVSMTTIGHEYPLRSATFSSFAPGSDVVPTTPCAR